MSSQSDVERIQREIEGLYSKQSDQAKKEASVSEKIASARAGASRATSASTLKSKLGEAERLERELVSIQKKKADIAKSIAGATTKLHKAQQGAFKDQARESREALDSLARQQSDFLQRQERRLLESTARTTNAVSKHSVDVRYDAFISHATEDKNDLVRPLAQALGEAGFKVWFDELELTVGDSLRRSIDQGLSASRFGIVVLSPSFFAKNWTQYELDGLVAREMEGVKTILPLWHKVSKNEVLRYSASLADKVALNTATHTIEELVEQLVRVLGK